MVTISDVAREAGVSTATVSRVLNGVSTVDTTYAARVHEAVDRLRYRRNGVARGLRRRSTDVLALVISDIGNPFFTAVTRGVEDVANSAGYSVLLCNADEEPGKESTYLRVAEEQQVAGVVISPHSADTDVSGLLDAGVPVAVLDRPLPGVAVDTVVAESVTGARLATEHLLDAGWRRPACVTGPQDASTALQRLTGYRQALHHDAGADEYVVHSSFDESGGARAARTLLSLSPPPDSFVVANAQLSLGLLGELGRHGLVAGRDVGVVGFDDAPWASLLVPALTVVAQPAYAMGARAAELVLERLSGAAPPAPRYETFTVSLEVRGSSLRTRD